MGHLSLRYLLPAALPNKVRVGSVLNRREFYDWVRRDAMAILGLHWNRIQRKKHFRYIREDLPYEFSIISTQTIVS